VKIFVTHVTDFHFATAEINDTQTYDRIAKRYKTAIFIKYVRILAQNIGDLYQNGK